MQVGSANDWRAIAAGSDHSLASRLDGSAWAWGRNSSGQLGDGTTSSRNAPGQVIGPGGTGFLDGAYAVAAGGSHSLVLRTATAWPVTATPTPMAGPTGTATPTAPPTAASTGTATAAATAAGTFTPTPSPTPPPQAGQLWAWGNDSSGQLGNGASSTPFVFPIQVPGSGGVGTLRNVTSVAAGGNFTLAVTADGALWAWGDNSYERLAIASGADSTHPSRVLGSGGLGFLSHVVAVAAGGSHILALAADGTVWAWGENSCGEVGNGTSTRVYRPVRVLGPGGTGALGGVLAVAAGDSHSLALTSDGAVWAWGCNPYGQLGTGGLGDRAMPTRVGEPGGAGMLEGVIGIAAGANHSLAVRGDGTVWAWGSNGNGQLGDGTATARFAPVRVSGGAGPTAVVSVAAGALHSLAMTTEGEVWAWGANSSGQLGDGTLTERRWPVRVAGSGGEGAFMGVRSIAAGGTHSLALRTDGSLWAWGSSSNGQLGDGSGGFSSMPKRVVGANGAGYLNGVVAVAAGGSHSAAVRTPGFGPPVAAELAVLSATGTYGDTVSLLATLSLDGEPVAGKPVTFRLAGMERGSATTDSSGSASLWNAGLGRLNAGAYPGSIEASFEGDAECPSASGVAALTVARAATQVWLNSMQPQAQYGGTITLSAEVMGGKSSGSSWTPLGPVDGGAVVFTASTWEGGAYGSVTLGGAITDVGGVARAEIGLGGLNAGSYNLTASFRGSANHEASSSYPRTLTITAPPATATPSASPSATATVAGTLAPTPSETAAPPAATATTAGSPTATGTALLQPTGTPTTLPESIQRIELHPGWNWISFTVVKSLSVSGADPTPTAHFRDYSGTVLLGGLPAPVGSMVMAFSPRGELVGRSTVVVPGYYGYMRVYGETSTSSSPIPGMRMDELITFEVNGHSAATIPSPAIWQEGFDPLQLDLVASYGVPVATALSSIEGDYDYVLGETGTFASDPGRQFLNTLTDLEPGKGYFVRMSRGAVLTIAGRRLAENHPIPLDPGWHWIGYMAAEGRDLPEALDSIEGKHDYLLGETGTYAAFGLPFLNTLSGMEPGKGYLIKMRQAGTLVYGVGSATSTARVPRVAPTPTTAQASIAPSNAPTGTPAGTP